MSKARIYLAGPFFALEEKEAMELISKALDDCGYTCYLPHHDGIEEDALMNPNNEALQTAYCCLDLYRIIEDSDCLLFNMNGRTPCEAGVFKAALAFAAGVPVVLYKEDNRSAFHGDDNSMLTGLGDFSKVSSIDKIGKSIQKALKRGRRNGSFVTDNLASSLKSRIELGDKINAYLMEHRPGESRKKDGRLLKKLAEMAEGIDSDKAPSTENIHKSLVYCSGPLFCPAEKSAMGEIAAALEDLGYGTFLPQRDGVERYVMNMVDNPFSNSIVFRPIQRLIHKAIFSLDVYQIIERCDCFVFNLNGRVPDEGAVVESALALVYGKPILVYKNDIRSACAGQLHPLLTMGGMLQAVDEIEEIPKAMSLIESDIGPKSICPPPGVAKVLKFGAIVWKIMGWVLGHPARGGSDGRENKR